MSLFRLDASIMPATSASRALADIAEAEWAAAHPDSQVVRRDVGTNPIPAGAWAAAVTAGFTPEADRTDEQRSAVALATELADELLAADALLFAVPLYNFGVAQTFKTWFDLVMTDLRIKDEGQLQGRPAILATVLGGNYSPGTPKEGWDHSTPWLSRVLGEVWGLDLHVVQREFTLVGVNPALDAFREMAADLHASADVLARDHGRAVADKRTAGRAA